MLLFDEVEILDFAGPYEVFSVTRNDKGESLFDVKTVAAIQSTIQARNGLSINPDYNFSNCPDFDMLIVPGGYGTRPLINNQVVLGWIKDQYNKVEILMTVCTGSLLLGKIGLFDNLPFCTHHMAYDEMEQIAPSSIPQKDHRFTQSGKIHSSGGISAGIDLAFHILESIHGRAMALKTAKHTEYWLKS